MHNSFVEVLNYSQLIGNRIKDNMPYRKRENKVNIDKGWDISKKIRLCLISKRMSQLLFYFDLKHPISPKIVLAIGLKCIDQ